MFYFFNRYLSFKTVLMWFSEFVLIFLSVALSIFLRLGFDIAVLTEYDPYFLKSLVLIFAYLVVFYHFDLYKPDVYRVNWNMVIKLLSATMVTSILVLCIYYVLPQFKIGRGILITNLVILPIIIVAWRMVFSKWFAFELPEKRVLIIGSSDLAKKVGTAIHTNANLGLKLVGFIDDDPAKLGKSIVNPGVIGGYGDISRLIDTEKVDKVIVSLADRRAKLPMSALLECKLKGVVVEEGTTFEERLNGKIPLDHLKPSWMVFSDGFKSLRSKKRIKRVIDIVCAGAGLVIAAPIMLVTTIIIKLTSRGPVIFRQIRMGEHGREFELYKFRSMRVDAEKNGPVWAQANDNRVTRVGSVIRTLRIDELPQLVNVLRGDMSFVGPRPERPFFVEKLKEVIPYYEMRTVVKPGITGWAQIKYPYGASVEDAVEKLQFDIYYIKNMSPLLDLLIIFWTLKVVLTGSGAR